MRQHLFGETAIQHEAVIQHKWRLLADWMGHANIEQTASTCAGFVGDRSNLSFALYNSSGHDQTDTSK